MKLKDFFQAVLKMPYHRNYAAVSGKVHNFPNHESAVEDVFIKSGFTNANLPNRKGKKSPISQNDRDRAMSDPNELLGIPNNSFIDQPCGTHASPDFIVNHNSKLYFVECKSSKSSQPTYNSGLPNKGYVYIFTSEKTNKTTVYMGDDIVNSAQRNMIENALDKISPILEDLNKNLKSKDSNRRGIDFYLRAMYNQKGNAEKTNYFDHENREHCEERVLRYVS